MKRGDVVLVVVQGELGKPRPAIVVQANELGDTTSAVIVCPLSSDLTEFNRTRPLLDPSTGNGLRVRSQIMTDKINALRRDRIRSVIGQIDAATSEQLDRALHVVLGLTR